jgi:hypothetical protein
MIDQGKKEAVAVEQKRKKAGPRFPRTSLTAVPIERKVDENKKNKKADNKSPRKRKRPLQALNWRQCALQHKGRGSGTLCGELLFY